MKAITHITVSAAASAGMYAAFGPRPAAGLLLAGTLIDIDHVGLYARAGLPMRPVDLLKSIFRTEGQIEKAYSISRGIPRHWYFPGLHSIELVFLFLVGAYLLPSRLLAGAAAGAVVHLFMDIRSYPCGLPFFSMTWRFLHRRKVMQAWTTHQVKVRF